jgi:hypothetical protein
MSKTFTKLFRTLLLFDLICSFSNLNAQKNISHTPEASSGFSLTVQNQVQTTPNTLEFDVYLLNTLPAGTTFELAQIQLGFLINSSIIGEGELSFTLSNDGSDLKSYQQFDPDGTEVNSSLQIYPTKTLLQQSPQDAPGAGSGTHISAVAPGTKLGHYILTNSVNFATNSVPGLVFISTSNPDPFQELLVSAVSYYSNSIVTNLPVNAGVNAIVNGNPVLNPDLGTSIDQNKTVMKIYSLDKNIIVNCTQNAKQVLIYNTLGSLVEKYTNVIGFNTFSLNKSPKGYYLVKIIMDNEVFTQKVLLK